MDKGFLMLIACIACIFLGSVITMPHKNDGKYEIKSENVYSEQKEYIKITRIETLNDTTILLTQIFNNGDTIQTVSYCSPKHISEAFCLVEYGAHYPYLNYMAKKMYHEIKDTVPIRSYAYSRGNHSGPAEAHRLND